MVLSPYGFAGAQDRRAARAERRGIEPQIDEARAGDGGLGDVGAGVASGSASAAASLRGRLARGLGRTMAALVAMSPCAGSRVGDTSTRPATSSGRSGTTAAQRSSTVSRMAAKRSCHGYLVLRRCRGGLRR